jgi:hypothetical protein
MAGTRKKGATSRNATPGKTSDAPPLKAARLKPGVTGAGDFYHVEIRPRSEFQTFRTQDVGKPGKIERVAGQRSSGTWDTQKWLIGKRLASVVKQRLVAKSSAARKVLQSLASPPKQIVGDRFRARPRPARVATKKSAGPKPAARPKK